MGHQARKTASGIFEEIPPAATSTRLPGGRKGGAYIPSMKQERPLQSIPDDELLSRLAELMRQSRRVESDLVAHIGELCCGRSYVA